jgi:hypothetical protein
MKILILLGENNEYLTCKTFCNDRDLDIFIDKIVPLMLANIDGKLTLKRRLEIVKDDYFHYAGAVIDFSVIDADEYDLKKPL